MFQVIGRLEAMQQPKLTQRQHQLGLVVVILVVSLRSIQRHAFFILCGKFQLRIPFGGMHLYRQHVLYIQYFQQVGQPAKLLSSVVT